MATEIKIVTADPKHILPLAAGMRQGDIDEVWATGHYTPGEALRSSMYASELVWTALRRGEPIAMFGVAFAGSILSDKGAPWLLGTDAVWAERRALLRLTPHYVDLMQGRFPFLCNYVDSRHTQSIRWLKWCGFTILPAVPWGIEQLPFHPFLRSSVHV